MKIFRRFIQVKRRFMSISMLALMMCAICSANLNAQNPTDIVRFVDLSVGDQGYRNDGKSWEKAKSDIQDAINGLHDYLEKNPNVEVAYVYVRGFDPTDAAYKSTATTSGLKPSFYYKPTESTETSENGTLFTSFKIYAGINVFGGFKGDEDESNLAAGETLLDLHKHRLLANGTEIGSLKGSASQATQMPWDLKYKTVLSGSHGTQPVITWNSSVGRYTMKYPSNSYHVVWFATNGDEYSTTDNKQRDHYRPLEKPALLNGCSITGGYAASKETAVREHAAMGGGIYMVGNATVQACEIYDCEATLRGGGVYLDGGGVLSHSHIFRCQTLGSGITDGLGGGVCLEYDGEVSDCYIERNVGRVGGGLSIVYQKAQYPSEMTKTNVHPLKPNSQSTIVSNNTSTAEAGGVLLYGGGTINHMTITKNKCVGQDVTYSGRRYGRSGGLYIDEIGMTDNSVIWGNKCAANNDIQYAATNTNRNRTIEGKPVGPIVYYVALQGNEVTNWMGTDHSNIYTLNKENKPSETTTNNYPYFSGVNPETTDKEGAIVDPAGVISEAKEATIWKPLAQSDLDLKGVQCDSEERHPQAKYLMNAQGTVDFVERAFDPISTLGAFTMDQEQIEAILFPSQYEEDGGEQIPTLFVDDSRTLPSDLTQMGSSWDKALANIPKAIDYFTKLRTEPYIGSEAHYVFKGNGNTYTKVQILVKEGTYTNAGPSSYLTDENGIEQLSTAAIRPITGLRLIGGYSDKLAETELSTKIDGETFSRNPKENLTRITANVIGLDYSNNSSHVVALVNTSHTYIDGFTLSDGNANQNLRGTEAFEPYGGGVLVNNKMQWAPSYREDMKDNVMKNCVVMNCEGTRRGAGVYVNGYYKKTDGAYSRVEFEMENCLVINNTTDRVRLADGTWDDGQGHTGTRQRFDIGGVVHANGNAKLTMNHCTIANNVGYGLSTSGWVEGMTEEDETLKKTCEIYFNNSIIIANAVVPLESRSRFGEIDYGDDATKTQPRHDASGNIITYKPYVICPEANIRGVNDYVDMNYEPDEYCKLTQLHTVLGYDSRDDKTYAGFNNPTLNIGAVENTNDVTLLGGYPDFTPTDMNPVVNKALQVKLNDDGSYQLDPSTQFFVDATEPETKGVDRNCKQRNIGGQGDVGALECLSLENEVPGRIIHVRMAGAEEDGKVTKEFKDDNGVVKSTVTYYNKVGESVGNDSNNGKTWSTPVATIKHALELAVEYNTKHPSDKAEDKAEIWIAAGTYKENLTVGNGNNNVKDHSGINVYGGFKAYGNPTKKLNERDISNLLPEYQTIIDGDMKGRVLFQRDNFKSKTVWEGLTIQNGVNFNGVNGTDNEPAEDGTGTVTETQTSEWSKGTYGKRIVSTIVRTGGVTYTNRYSILGGTVGCGAYIMKDMVLKNCLVRKNKLYGNPQNGEFKITRYSKSVTTRVQESKDSEDGDVTSTPIPGKIISNEKFYILTPTQLQNCTIGACGIYMHSGSVVENCVIRNNESFMYKTAGKGAAVVTGTGVYSEGAKLANSLIVENQTHDGSNATGVAMYVTAQSQLYHCTIAYNKSFFDPKGPQERNRPACLPGVWDGNASSDLGETEFNNKATKFYNCVLWGNVGNGHTGENYNPVGRTNWEKGVGKPGFFYNCYHSAPSEKFALEGVNKDRTTVDNPSVVYVTHTFDASKGVPVINKDNGNVTGDTAVYNIRATELYYKQCIAQNLFNEAAEDENGILKYPIVNGMSDNPYAINASSELSKHNINMGDENWTTEMTKQFNIDEDIAGADRIQDCVVDKGAYEYNGSGDISPNEATAEDGHATATYYVTWNGRGNTSAGSPSTAACHQKLQKVLDAAGRYKYDHPNTQVIVKVASYTLDGKSFGYYPTRTTNYEQAEVVNPREYSIQVPRGVEVWGGYNDSYSETKDADNNVVVKTGFDDDQRNILGQKTLFTGVFDYYSNGTTTPTHAFHVVTFTDYIFDDNGNPIVLSTDAEGHKTYKQLSDLATLEANPTQSNPYYRSVLDGLFIENGNADGAKTADQRGGACVVPAYGHIRNCVVQNNSAKGDGGALYVKPWAIVSGSIIQKNEADRGAGVFVEERYDTDGKPIYTDKDNPIWSWLISNTIVENTASTSGGGLYFNTNVRAYSNVMWQNIGNDMPNVSGTTDTGQEQSVDLYPIDYCAVQDLRISGVNNIELAPESNKGTRWVKDENILEEDKKKLKDTDKDYYNFYYIMKSSVLVRSGLPYSYYSTLLSQFPSLELYDINGVARMAEDLTTHTLMYNKVNSTLSQSLIKKDNSFIEIGARALNDNLALIPEMIMTRLFVAHTNVMNTNAAEAFQTKHIPEMDEDYATLSAEDKAKVDQVKFYQQVGSSFANPFTRMDDALRYIIDARKNYPNAEVTSPQSFVTGTQKVRDVRFEVYLTGGTYYPNFDQYGTQGTTRNNTFLIPEKVSIIGGTQLGLDKNDNTATQFYCQDKTQGGTENEPVLTAGTYKLYGETTNMIREKRPLYDLNHNSIVEPWEMKNQSILSGQSASSDAKNVYHVVTISGDKNLVGWQPRRYNLNATDDANMTDENLLDTYPNYEAGTETQPDYDKTAALDETNYAGKESTFSFHRRDVMLDGLTITGGYAAEYSAEGKPNRNDFYRGGGILVNGNKYVKDGEIYKGWDSETDAMGLGDRLIMLNVANCAFLGNAAIQGGAIYSNGNVVVTSSSFQQNQTIGAKDQDLEYAAYSGGGAIAVSGRFNAGNCLFANNEATRGDKDLTISNGTPDTDGWIKPKNNITLTYKKDNSTVNRDANTLRGSGGAIFGNYYSKLVAVNCNFVRNKSFAFPAIFSSRSNYYWDGEFPFEDYVRHYATNTLFWGNAITATASIGDENIKSYSLVLNSSPFSKMSDKNAIQGLYFCAYRKGYGPEASEDDEQSRSYYQNLGYTETEGMWKTMGHANHNIILNENNDALDGPNFIQPSTVAGVAGYMPAANWLIYRINSLVDNGWTALKLDDNGDFVYEKDQYGADDSTDAYPDAPDDAKPSGSDSFIEGDYMWRARLFRQNSGLDMLPIGDQKYMYYAQQNGEENQRRPMLRVSKDALARTGKTYIDIGVYEYQHAQLNLADGDDIDVMWVAPREDPENGNDGRTFDTPTSDLQRAIEMLLLTRCGHQKELRIKEGTYAPIYQLDDGNYGFNIHVGDNSNHVALKREVTPGLYYGIQSLTIKGGYSETAEDDYNPETHPVTLQMTDHGGAKSGAMAHLLYIYDTEQWSTQQSTTDGSKQKESRAQFYALPITVEGLTFINPYASGEQTDKGGSAICYKDQYQSISETVKKEGKTETQWKKQDGTDGTSEKLLGQAVYAGFNKTGATHPWKEDEEIIIEEDKEITPSVAPKLTIRNCIFQQNGADGATSIPAVSVGKGGGEALIYNSLFHSNSGNPVVGIDTKVINCTMALNGGHTTLTNTGHEYQTSYYLDMNSGKKSWTIGSDLETTSWGPENNAEDIHKLEPAATYNSELHNSLIWKDGGDYQFEVQDGQETLTEATPYPDNVDGVVTFNAVTDIMNGEDVREEAATGIYTNARNVGLNDLNDDSKTGPNFVDPENADPSKRDFHLNPSIPTMSKANNKVYVIKVKKITDVTVDYSGADTDEKKYNAENKAYGEKLTGTAEDLSDYEKELAHQIRLHGPGMERGAYECLAFVQRVYYVNPQRGQGSGERNGTKWATAYGQGQLQTAIDAAAVYSALNDATSYVFVKANNDANGIGENIVARDGVLLFGSLPSSFYEEAYGRDVAGSMIYEDYDLSAYVVQMLAARDGIATKNVPHTNIQNLNAYDGTFKLGFLMNGFVIKPYQGQESVSVSPVKVRPTNGMVLQNSVIHGFTMTNGDPVVDMQSGLMYNCLIYGNTMTNKETPVVNVGRNAYVVNCTMVAENSGEIAVKSSTDLNDNPEAPGTSIHVLNSISYNLADNTIGRGVEEAYLNCNTKTGMFAPYQHNSPYAPAHLTNYEPYWYQLHEQSSCIDAGLTDMNEMKKYVKFVTGAESNIERLIHYGMDRDLLGNPRTIGTSVDLGCYETWKISDTPEVSVPVLMTKVTNTEKGKDADGNAAQYPYPYAQNFGGHYYAHPGSVVYVGKNAAISLKEGDFTYGEAFRPGYLLMKANSSLYGNKGVIGLDYVAVERAYDKGFYMNALPYAYKWGDAETTSYNDSGNDELIETNIASTIDGAWTYNGEKRSEWNYSFAETASPCWEDLDKNIQIPATDGWLVHFKEKPKSDVRFTGYSESDQVLLYKEEGFDKTITLTQYNSTETASRTGENSTKNYPQFTTEQNMGWNMKGIPYLVAKYNTATKTTTDGGMDRYAMHIPHIVYVVKSDGTGFNVVKSWEDGTATINLGTACFTQTAVLGGTGATETVTFAQPIWTGEVRQASAKMRYAMALLDEAENGDEVLFTPSDNSGELTYSYGRDGVKWPAFDSKIPQVWMQNAEGTPFGLADEAPRETEIALGTRIPASGSYTFALTQPDDETLDHVWLIDRETSSIVDLTQTDYIASVTGHDDPDVEPLINTTRFAIQLGGSRPGISEEFNQRTHQVFVRQHVLHITNTLEGETIGIFTTAGAAIQRATAPSGEYTTELENGIYIVKVAGDSFKVIVR